MRGGACLRWKSERKTPEKIITETKINDLPNEKFKDKLLYVYLGGYAIIRFCMEFLRGDDLERGVWFGISTSQWISIGLLVFAAIMITRSVKKTVKPEET